MLRNGDRIVGEIKSLDDGALTYKTDDVGTLTIKWDKVFNLISRRYFEVETEEGRRYYGSLQSTSEPRRIVIAVVPFVDTLDVLSVIRLYPIGRSFWSRIDGKVNLAMNFQRANRLRSLGLDFEARYRTRVRLTRLQSNSYFQVQEDAEQTSRNSVSLNQTRFLANRWVLAATGLVEQNEELDLEVRALLSAGGGRFLMQSIRSEIVVLGGVAFTNERFSGSSATSNLELVATGQASYIRRDYPKTDVRGTLTLYPNVTDLGRIRVDVDLSLSRELIRDFSTGLTFFDRYDSRPPSEGAAKNDFGFALTAGWLF